MNKYYVYCYLDPTKPGKYKYDGLEVCFLYEPFYIGKGKNYRSTRGLREKSFNNYKINKIKLIKDNGFDVIVNKLAVNLSEIESLNIERYYIGKIGKFTNGGTLVNIEYGGDISYISELTRLKMSENHADFNGDKNPMYNRKHNSETKSLISNRLSKYKRPVVQFDIIGNKINRFESICEASRVTGISKTNISACCLKIGHTKTLKKTFFIFEGDNIILPTFNGGKKVVQISLDGDFINEYESISDARRQTNICKISACVLGNRRSAGGYKWKYKDDYDKK